jgi:PAS domain S-box-containing protein
VLPNDVSLLFLITLVALIHGAVLLGTLRIGAPRGPALFFIAGCLLLAAGGTGVWLPPTQSALRAFLLNVLPLLSYAAWLAGMLLLCGLRRRLPLLALAVGLAALAISVLGFVPALRDERIAIVTGGLAVLRLATAGVLLRFGKGFDRRFALMLALVMLVEAAAMGQRAVTALAGHLPTIAADPEATTSLTWLTMLMSALLGTPLLLLLGLGRVIAVTREAAARYRATLDALPDAVLQVDAEGRVQSVHRGMALAATAVLEGAQGRPLGAILPAALGARARAALDESAASSRLLPAVAVDDADGRHWFEVSSAPQRDGDGRAHGHVLIIRDVSQREQAESNLHYRTQLLERLFVNSPIGLLLSDAADGRLRDANPAFLQQCGWERGNLLARRHADLLAPAGPTIAAELTETLASGGRCGPLDLLLARGDGGAQPVRLSAFTLRDAEGQALVWTLAEDTAERQRAARLKNELVSVVSHELRTPLTSITGALGLVVGTSGGQLPDGVRTLLGVASDNCRRLRLLVDDLLDLDRLIAGRMPLDLQLQPLGPLLQATVEAIRPFASSREIRLAAPPAGLALQVDAGRFQQALSNLLSNALKFSPDGSAIDVHVERDGEAAEVVVGDRGPGVPADFVPQLFERFAQADASDTRARGGSGLGLAIVRELCERMGGSVAYRPNPGGGAQFRLRFPALAAQAAATP